MNINLLLQPASNSTAEKRAYTTAPPAPLQACFMAPPSSIPTSSYPHSDPVLPAIAELHRHPGSGPPPQSRPLYAGQGPSPNPQGVPGTNRSPPSQMNKRAASQTPLPDESPAKKLSQWTPKEDKLMINLRGQGMKWGDVAKQLHGRSSTSCRVRYHNNPEKLIVWDEEMKNKLARLYDESKSKMWQMVTKEMGIPWHSAESMHWQLGEQGMSARVNVPVSQLPPSTNSIKSIPPQQPPQYHHHFSTRKTDPESQSRFRSQIGPALPQINPESEAGLNSCAQKALASKSCSHVRRDSGARITGNMGQLNRSFYTSHELRQLGNDEQDNEESDNLTAPNTPISFNGLECEKFARD